MVHWKADNMNFKWIGMSADGSKVEIKKLKQFNVPLSDINELAGSDRLRKAAVVDVETTGLDTQSDEVIDLAARIIFYDQSNGQIISVAKDTFQQLNEPSKPIPNGISKLTGITNDQVIGKKINWQSFAAYIKDVDLIVSHNAPFDRPFIDRNVRYPKIPWACSVRNIDWLSKGYDSTKLTLLSIYHGFFNDSHSAASDVNSLIHLLSQNDFQSGRMYFSELIVEAFIPRVLITVYETRFEIKDEIKFHGYKWVPSQRSWIKLIKKKSLEAELNFLGEIKNRHDFKYKISDLPLSETYKDFHSIIK